MELIGYGSQGFSYTDNYKESIYYLNFCLNFIGNSEMMSYKEFQHVIYKTKIEKKIIKIQETEDKESSEIRMLLKPMFKYGLIDKNHIEVNSNGEIKAVKIDSDFFSVSGKEFLKILTIEHIIKNEIDKQKQEKINLFIKKIINEFCIFQIYNLFNEKNCVYKDIFSFLLKYKTMNKSEFYIMATYRQKNKDEELDDAIQQYRNSSSNKEVEIKNNINDFNTYTKQLEQYELIVFDNNKGIKLSKLFYKYFEV